MHLLGLLVNSDDGTALHACVTTIAKLLQRIHVGELASDTVFDAIAVFLPLSDGSIDLLQVHLASHYSDSSVFSS